MILDLDENLVKAIHPDYPTPIEVLNQKYREHTQEVVIAIVTWFDEQVPRHLVQLALPDDDMGKLLSEMAQTIHNAQKIHQPWANSRWGQQRCAGCGKPWPCNTSRALAGNRTVGDSTPAVDRGDEKL